MMATEATSENFATISSTPDHELNTTESTSHDVPSEQLVVNGTAEKDGNKPGTPEPTEGGIISAEVSVSGGSDTETSKAEASKTQGDEKGHVRTASTIKKFASFKPVSVNKTFLAAKGATSAIPSKLGEKSATTTATAQTGPSATAALRPRLVAKTVSGLRDSTPRTASAANGGKAGAAPDASAVWNKNRPAPPPEPKRFTDEELKQRYGIHLATRLQSDDPGRQANWADIDDDDDDWAPETIEWTDGTKITLPHPDEAPPPPPPPEPSVSPALKDMRGLDAAKPKSPALSHASASPTIKPSGFGSGRAGLVLKGASEKPTLVAKPPGPPTPVKSPWASLPPVDKVAPVAIEMSHQSHQPPQSRFNQRDPHGFHGMPPPAKEIAADDFSRTWRDSPSSASRELYNSQSGRYEPVNDNRRGSRHDATSRQPALLHRPLQQDGPAEPSAAFQTHRAGGQDSGYGRRRTSSTVSGGSGNFVRRMSRGDMPPPHDTLNARRGSLAAVSDAPSSPRTYSPSGQHQNLRGYQNQHWQSRTSPVLSHSSPQPAHGQLIPPAPPADGQSHPPSAALTQEELVAEQKKIMRQTRELAIKRRQEEEAREEAERKERIRVKLEAMGPAPEKKPKKESPRQEKSVPTHIQTRDAAEAVLGPSAILDPEVGAEANLKSSKSLEEQSSQMDSQDVKVTETRPTNHDSRPNGLDQGMSTQSAAAGNQPAQDSRSSQQWQNTSISSDRFNTWAAAPTQQSSSRNVWGPPSNDRTLGNGTFNPELSRLPEINQSSSHPGPIGPPNSSRGNTQFQPGRGREYGSRPAPIAPPTRQTGPRQPDPRVASSGWGALPDRIAQEDRLAGQQRETEIAKKRELEEAGLAPEVPQPVYKDTWRQVTMNEDGSRSKVQGSFTTINDGQANQASWKPQEETASRAALEDRRLDVIGKQDISQPQFSNDAWRSSSGTMNASPAVRGSRFFPNNHRDVRLEDQSIPFDRPGSPTPPPPTMAGHPAYDGDSAHPLVSLPRPAPVVKLPPALAPIGPPKPASFAAAVSAPTARPVNNGYQGRQDHSVRQASYQDIRREQPTGSGGWQDRISSLLGRNNTAHKSHALAVDSSSKNALELPTSQFTATVSLPNSVTGDLAADDGSVFSKPAAEECFEEQEMGSLPVIKVPNSAPSAAWSLAAPSPKTIPRKFVVSQVTTIDALQFPLQVNNNTATINIFLPGQEEVKIVTMPASRQRSNPRRGGSRGGNPRHSSSSHPRGGRGRDSSSGFQSPSLDSASVSSSPSGRGGHRGNGRGYGSNWNRHVSTPVHT